MKNDLDNSDSVAVGKRRGLRRLWPRRLGIQLILLFSLMLAGSMIAFSYRMLEEVVESNTSSMKMQAGVLANNIAATGANFLLVRDYVSIEQMLLRSIDFPGVIAIQVCDAGGILLGDVSRTHGKAPAVQFGKPPLQVPTQATPSMQLGVDQMVVWQPILLGDLLGWTKITYSLRDIAEAEKRFWLVNGLVGSAIIAMTLVGLILLMRRPLASVNRYTEFAGNLNEMHGKTIPVDCSSLELQKLGNALNGASVRLEEQGLSVNNAMAELESLAAFPENNPNIVLSMDDNAQVTYLNPDGWRTLTSIEPWSDKFEVLQPQKIEVLLPHDYRAIIERCLSDGETSRSVEAEFNQRTWMWTFAPLPSQRIVHGYGLEITKRKQAEEYARNVLAEKLAAEAANQAKSVFLANMSHEIRTPLNGVLGFLKLLSRTTLTGTQREYLNTTEVSAKMLLTVINDILDFSKVEAGKVSIEHIEIEFKELLEDIVSLHAANAETKGLDLFFVFSRAVPTRLLGDPARITQVMSNFLGNAIKFTKQGEILVQVELQQETDAEVVVEVSVKDSGIGIAPESLARLFQPFSQADDSTTRKYGGTGLGLVIAKTLVELMGGYVSVESQEGEGARFAFTLRLPKQKPDTTDRAPANSMAGLRILAVTPKEMVARSLLENLHGWGITADSASNGIEALEAIRQRADMQRGYDAVIVDDVIEKMTAKDFVSALKALPQFASMHAILLEGISKCLHAEETGLDGFSACISKPATSTELHECLRTLFIGSNKVDSVQAPRSFQIQSRETGGPLRVLIVDDNEINRKLAKILVEQMGGETDLAEDGAQALAACAQQPYDLILMDAHMPIMDGIEATSLIRASEKNTPRHALIIALTADAMSGDRERYLAAGMDDYLTKPINEQAFTRALHNLGLTVAVAETDVAPDAELTPGQDKPAPLPILDPTKGIELSFGDRETWRVILGMLYESLPEYAASLIAARASGDPDNLFHVAHKLAGASSYCGTLALSHQAKQVENIAKTRDHDLTLDAVDELLQQIDRLQMLMTHGVLPEGDSPRY